MKRSATEVVRLLREALLLDLDFLLEDARRYESRLVKYAEKEKDRAERERAAIERVEKACERVNERATPKERGERIRECLEAKREAEKVLSEP